MADIGSYADQSELPPPGGPGSNTQDYSPTTPSPDDGTTFTSPLSGDSTVGGTSPSGGVNFGNLGSTLSNITGMTPQQMAVLAGGGQMLSNAGQFTTQSQQDAAYLDPAQQFQTGYGKQLQALEANPSSVANTPGYQFALQQGLGAVGRADMAKGGAVPDSDDVAFASGLASQTYNSQVAQLTQLSGANFSPQSAASILQTGMLGNIGAQTAGMNAITAGLLGPGNTTNNYNGTPTNYTPGGTNYTPAGSTTGGFNMPGGPGGPGSGYNISTGSGQVPIGAAPPGTGNENIVPGSPDQIPGSYVPPPDYGTNTDNGGSMFDPSWFNSMSS